MRAGAPELNATWASAWHASSLAGWLEAQPFSSNGGLRRKCATNSSSPPSGTLFAASTHAAASPISHAASRPPSPSLVNQAHALPVFWSQAWRSAARWRGRARGFTSRAAPSCSHAFASPDLQGSTRSSRQTPSTPTAHAPRARDSARAWLPASSKRCTESRAHASADPSWQARSMCSLARLSPAGPASLFRMRTAAVSQASTLGLVARHPVSRIPSFSSSETASSRTSPIQACPEPLSHPRRKVCTHADSGVHAVSSERLSQAGRWPSSHSRAETFSALSGEPLFSSLLATRRQASALPCIQAALICPSMDEPFLSARSTAATKVAQRCGSEPSHGSS